MDELNKRIKQMGIKKSTIADNLGISIGTLYNKLDGKTQFYAGEAIKLSRMLQIDVREFSNFFAQELE